MRGNRLLGLLAGVLTFAVVMPGNAAEGPRSQISARPVSVRTDIVPPAVLPSTTLPGSVTLQPGPTSEMLRTVTVKRRFTIDALRVNPVIASDHGTIDLRPVLANPATPSNIAGALKTMPRVARVSADSFEVLQIDQGLILRQYVSYRLNPGVCATGSLRTQLDKSGASCFERLPDTVRRAAFADPGNPRYVADPSARKKAISEASKVEQESQAQIASDLGKLRELLADQRERSKIVALIGEAQAAQLEALNDDELEAQVVNMADVEIEETMFVPANDHPLPTVSIRPDLFSTPPRLGAVKPRQSAPTQPVEASHSIEEHIYLTGFTLGRAHEWRRRISVTIAWCVLGCKKTYYVEASAGFDYGLGLRLPFTLGGTWSYTQAGSQETASFTPVFKAVNADAVQYADAGVPRDKVFDGKEIVAQFGAHAGIGFKIPFHGQGGVSFDPRFDLTSYLPGGLHNGQFTPPLPGKTLAVSETFSSLDMLGGMGNFGVVGAKVMPAVKFELIPRELSFQLFDRVSGETVNITRSRIAYPVAVDPGTHMSRFTLGNPVYSLSFALTPGITARLFVDVSVWSKNWDWPVWFPELAVELPPGGAKFSCHVGTVCSRDYAFSAARASESGGEQVSADPWERKIQEWKRDFEPRWQARCPTSDQGVGNLCRASISGLAQTSGNEMLNAIRRLRAGPLQIPMKAGEIVHRGSAEAEQQAGRTIEESQEAAQRRSKPRLQAAPPPKRQ